MLPKSSKFAPLAGADRLPKRTKAFRIVADERGDRPNRIRAFRIVPDAEEEARFSAEAPINEANGLKMWETFLTYYGSQFYWFLIICYVSKKLTVLFNFVFQYF